MKKLVLHAAMAVFGMINLHAQDFNFGAKAGINFASIYGDTDGIDPITSLVNIGIVGELVLTEKFSFQPELLYSIQGFSVGEDVVELNYLNLPLMGKYYLSDGLSLEMGPQIGLLLSDNNAGRDVKDNFKTLDFGFNAGLGYKLGNGINFGLRYNLGLSNINTVDGSSAKFKNGVASNSLDYFFLRRLF